MTDVARDGPGSRIATARLDLRLTPSDKADINLAALLLGVPVAQFVRDAAMREINGIVASDLAEAAKPKRRKPPVYACRCVCICKSRSSKPKKTSPRSRAKSAPRSRPPKA